MRQDQETLPIEPLDNGGGNLIRAYYRVARLRASRERPQKRGINPLRTEHGYPDAIIAMRDGERFAKPIAACLVVE